MDILQYESKVWSTADLLISTGVKQSDWPSFMMPFLALVLVESRLLRMLDELKEDLGEENLNNIRKDDFRDLVNDKGQGYNYYLVEKGLTLSDICKNDKTFETDLDAYLHGFDGETKDLLGVDAVEGEKFLDIRGVIAKLKAKKVLLGYTKLWAEIDLKPFNNSEVTTLEEHIKRKWADISAETAGEQYTPSDIISLISDIAVSKLPETGKLLKIYDPTCGGGNMLFGVEDRLNQSLNRLTQTFGQDWNDALYALAKIESRFRDDSKIEHGNTLVSDKFDLEEFELIVANPPYGIPWGGFEKDIRNDKTKRYKFIPNKGDGQLLFLQHIASKMDENGLAIVVLNGSSLFSGDAGKPESNIRKWMLESQLVEAVIQLPTDEFFNTGIHTYLWVLNKKRALGTENSVLLIDASEKWNALKKNKGSKKRELSEIHRSEIVQSLLEYKDNDYSKIFDKEHFYFNKQAIILTNVDRNGETFETQLPRNENKRTGELVRASSEVLSPTRLTDGNVDLIEFNFTEYCETSYSSLQEYYEAYISPFINGLDYKEQPIKVYTDTNAYFYDVRQDTLVREDLKSGLKEPLGCGKIVIKSALKKSTKKLPQRIEITVELTPDYQKDFEVIPFNKDPALNQKSIEAFMAKYISKPFEYLENIIGVEINFNKIFYKPEAQHSVEDVLKEIAELEKKLKQLDKAIAL